MKPRYLALFTIAIAASLSFNRLLDLLFHPWAYSLPGTVSAVGSWSGAVVLPSGARHALLFELVHTVDHSRDDGSSPALEGSVYTCAAGAPKQFAGAIHSPVHGASWSGARVRLELRSDLGIDGLPGSLECAPSRDRLRCERIEFRRATLADFQRACSGNR